MLVRLLGLLLPSAWALAQDDSIENSYTIVFDTRAGTNILKGVRTHV